MSDTSTEQPPEQSTQPPEQPTQTPEQPTQTPEQSTQPPEQLVPRHPINDKVGIYILTWKNPERSARVASRFARLGLEANIIESVGDCMDGHMDMISKFYNSDKPYGIFGEDDIYLHKELANRLDDIIKDFTELSLNVLLLGYLIPFKLEHWFTHFPTMLERPTYRFQGFPSDLWGTQMYMIDKAHAKYILENLNTPEKVLPNSFSADWVLTKYGKRAIIYPMLAVEEGHVRTDNVAQINFHR